MTHGEMKYDARPGEPPQLSEDDEAKNSAGGEGDGFSPPRRKAFQGDRSHRRRRRGADECLCRLYDTRIPSNLLIF